jgi:peptidoglycan hydrolase-like amidase
MKKAILFVVLPLALCIYTALPSAYTTLEFANTIDAISFTMSPTADVRVRSFVNNQWQAWHALEVETEFDPLLRESNLVVFDAPTSKIQIQTSEKKIMPHPIILPNIQPSYEVAALVPERSTRKILLRRQWGANDDFLVQGTNTVRSDVDTTSNETDAPTERENTCTDLQQKYPNEFITTNTKTVDGLGRTLRWPQEYSPTVHSIVVHHTAASNSASTRSGYETMQALYAYHANSRGWGDIGYHYIIDSAGQIYEGKAGGKSVVGGHAYCNNIGTIGVALMGNFETEAPSAEQTASLSWLIDYLSKEYKINLSTNVQYHGTVRPPVVGHRDLVSTACPGAILYPALPQIRSNAQRRNFTAKVTYDAPKTVSTPGSNSRSPVRTAAVATTSAHQIQLVGDSTLILRPSGFTNIQLVIRTGSAGLEEREAIATISRSNSTIGIWQLNSAGEEVRALNRLVSFKQHAPAQTVTVPLRIQAPETEGTYTIRFGTALLRLKVEGRRSKAEDNPLLGSVTTTNTQRTRTVERKNTSAQTLVKPSTSLLGLGGTSRKTVASTTDMGPNIRVKLSYSANIVTLNVGAKGTALGLPVNGAIELQNANGKCAVVQSGRVVTEAAILPITSAGDAITITSWQQTLNVFRGTIECRIQDGAILLINELPLEHYMWGLSEEPDTEPYEKQRAFAIAARTYAAHYLSDKYRKFPGKPYDGSDSPAEFQKYSGRAYEGKNPRWLEAVKDTANIVLKKDGAVIRAPYYSSNDGRTRSPAERGWNSFPFAEVFSSKPDPWCNGLELRGHGVGMSGCGAKGQALEGKTGEQILQYYYTGITLEKY